MSIVAKRSPISAIAELLLRIVNKSEDRPILLSAVLQSSLKESQNTSVKRAVINISVIMHQTCNYATQTNVYLLTY